RRLALRAAARLGHGGRRSVRDLGLRARGHAGQSRALERRQGGRGRGGTGVTRTMGTTLAALALATTLAAQEFHPPPVRRGHDAGKRLGLFGLVVRGGLDVGSSQLVSATTVAAGNVVTPGLELSAR